MSQIIGEILEDSVCIFIDEDAKHKNDSTWKRKKFNMKIVFRFEDKINSNVSCCRYLGI